jgi:hypothetical protein
MQFRNALATSSVSALRREAFDVKVSTSGRKVADWIMRMNDLSPATSQLYEHLISLCSRTNRRGPECCSTMVDSKDAAHAQESQQYLVKKSGNILNPPRDVFEILDIRNLTPCRAETLLSAKPCKGRKKG